MFEVLLAIGMYISGFSTALGLVLIGKIKIYKSGRQVWPEKKGAV